MIVRTIRASRGRLKAEVVVGVNELGGNVVLQVDVDRRREDVQAAMITFENLMLREAQAQLGQAQSSTEIERKVRERTKDIVQTANQRAQDTVERETAAAQSEAKRLLREALQAISRVLSAQSVDAPGGNAEWVPTKAVREVITSIQERQSA